MSPQGDYPLSDLALSRRLEGAEARSNAAFVEARAEVFPDSGAEWIEVAGASAMFDGVASPLTQTFGLGMLHLDLPTDFDAWRKLHLKDEWLRLINLSCNQRLSVLLGGGRSR